MYPLPLVLRELYVASRRPSTFRLRMAFGAGGMGLAVWSFFVWGSAHGNGRGIYAVLFSIAAVFALGAAILAAGDAVSRERREGTLGFLFLTDLQPADVILGKFAAAALVPASTLLALFPALALCQFLGGIEPGQFWRGILSLLATLFFGLCVTLFASTRCEDHRKAHALAAALLLLINPLWLCLLSIETYYAKAPFLYWLGVPLMIVLGVVMLGSACAKLGGVWQDSAEKWTRRDDPVPARVRLRLLESNPVAWLMLRRRMRRRPGLIVLLTLAGLGLVAAAAMIGGGGSIALLLGLLLLLHLGTHAVVLIRTAYSFYTDRQDGSLELLLGTKLSMGEVFTGFNKFLQRKTRWVLIVLGIVDLAPAVVIAVAGLGGWAAMPLAMAGTLWAAVLGLGWTGVYRSLLSDHPWAAMIGAFARLSFFPLVISVAFLFAPSTNPMQVAIFWLIASGFTALFFGLDASAALVKHGRELLVRPFSEKPPHIENEWSFIDWEAENDRVPERQGLPGAAELKAV